jgi:hypothetical protein
VPSKASIDEFSETMPMLRAPSRTQVLRDYLDDAAEVCEAEAQPWREPRAMADARERLRNEARQLRAAGTPTSEQRWALLYGLGGRLFDLTHHLHVVEGVPAGLYSMLTSLAAVIDATGDIDHVWNEALDVLDAFAAGASPDSSPTASEGTISAR